MDHAAALAYWERALTEEFGVIIELDKPEGKRTIMKDLYEARAKSGNPDLDVLMIANPGDNPAEIWIVKKTTDMSDIK